MWPVTLPSVHAPDQDVDGSPATHNHPLGRRFPPRPRGVTVSELVHRRRLTASSINGAPEPSSLLLCEACATAQGVPPVLGHCSDVPQDSRKPVVVRGDCHAVRHAPAQKMIMSGKRAIAV